MREITRMGTSVGRALAAAALIVAVQWLVMTMVTDWRWQLGFLAVPALFAGASVARLLADHDVVSMRRGGGRR
ncbi:hypothetical protein [Actinophytocola xanthii]|nr:hypothetical protein [Actinophytocola xanthii]